ncbi:hypothetical protein OAP14_01205 [Aliiglaciecola sp.]|nr:hypothetical protein [Aliiglaciecola sp.]
MKRIVVTTSLLIPFFCSAAEVEYAASVEGSYIHIENSDGDGDENRLDTFSLDPRISLIFNSRRFKAVASGSNRLVDRHLSSNVIDDTSSDTKNSFSSYDLTATAVIIEDFLTISGNTSQFYSNSGVTSSLITDEVFRSNSLAKAKRSGGNFRFGLPNPRLFNLNVSGGYDKVTTDRTESEFGDTEEVDSETVNYQAQFTQGNEVRNVSWNILANYADTQGRSQNDVITERVNGSFYLGLMDNLRFVATGSTENNELSTADDSDTNTRELEYKSAGAGLSYYQSNSRYIDLTYNVSSQQDGERDKFVGVNFNWAFSARTQASGEFSRRFFGRSGSFSLQHRVRKLRTSINYNETVTTYSRLRAGDPLNGVFVCPDAGEFTDCFIPDSIDYQLEAGEQFVPLSIPTFVVSEEPILRKSLGVNVGYTFRKIQADLRVSNSETSFLNTQREQDAFYTTLSLSLNLNRRASLSFSNSFSDITRGGSSGLGENEKTLVSTLGYNYELSADSTAKAEFSYANQDSPVPNRDFNTRRLTLSFSYNFR